MQDWICAFNEWSDADRNFVRASAHEAGVLTFWTGRADGGVDPLFDEVDLDHLAVTACVRAATQNFKKWHDHPELQHVPEMGRLIQGPAAGQVGDW